MQDRIKTQTSQSDAHNHFISDQSGATAIEYALIAGGLSIVILASVNGVGGELVTLFTDVADMF